MQIQHDVLLLACVWLFPKQSFRKGALLRVPHSAGVTLAVTSLTVVFLTGHGPLPAFGRCTAEQPGHSS